MPHEPSSITPEKNNAMSKTKKRLEMNEQPRIHQHTWAKEFQFFGWRFLGTVVFHFHWLLSCYDSMCWIHWPIFDIFQLLRLGSKFNSTVLQPNGKLRRKKEGRGIAWCCLWIYLKSFDLIYFCQWYHGGNPMCLQQHCHEIYLVFT